MQPHLTHMRGTIIPPQHLARPQSMRPSSTALQTRVRVGHYHCVLPGYLCLWRMTAKAAQTRLARQEFFGGRERISLHDTLRGSSAYGLLATFVNSVGRYACGGRTLLMWNKSKLGRHAGETLSALCQACELCEPGTYTAQTTHFAFW